jgi:hypothetical protein
MINRQILLSILVCAGLAIGCASAAPPTATIAPSAAPTAVAAATIPTLGLEVQPLDAGTYRLELNRIAVAGAKLPPILITVPDHWNSAGWLLNQPRSGESAPPVAVQFWEVEQVYRHPCQWKGSLFWPGPTVDDLAKALAEVPLRNATKPIAVTLDGYSGKYLEWSVPADIDFSKCDADGAEHFFESWTGSVVGDEGDRYQQGPGQVDRLWILDISGTNLVIDGFSMPSGTDKEREDLLGVVKSIRFER